MSAKQSTSRLIMVRPANFGFNDQTAHSNRFQNTYFSSIKTLQERALIEFDQMVEQLRSHHVHVDVIEDTYEPIKPDAIFPNNWFSTDANGTIILYPMCAENRRYERRKDLVDHLIKNFHVKTMIDLSMNEQRQSYLEGTGSLVLDRLHRIAYACRSIRTDPELIDRFVRYMNYERPAMIFDSYDDKHQPIYHTNVMMSIGTKLAILCAESIVNEDERNRIIQSLEHNGERKLLLITFSQMKQFAGNMLEIENELGQRYFVMSKSAYQSLTDNQRTIFDETRTSILYFDISTIEQCGGGSVRCMIAENFLLNK